MKKMNLLILPMILLVSGSCDPVNDENSLRPRPDSPESITYSDAADVPVIHTVDESDYTVYYIDSDNGSDSNDGLSESDAFKSFSPVAGLSKPEGTKILLKKGCTYSGPLVLKELGGTYSKPFIVDAYGEGDRPVISGTGDYAVLIQDDNIRFRNAYLKNIRVYLSAQNVFCLTGYKGVDPEVSLSGLNPGIESTTYYPRTRTFTLGATFTF